MRDEAIKTLAFKAAAVGSRHIGLDPGLVQKHKTPMIELFDQPAPGAAATPDIRPLLFDGVYGFF